MSGRAVGPRRAPAPRPAAGARGPGGPRGTGGPRRPGHASADGYAAREIAAPAPDAVESLATAPPRARRGLSDRLRERRDGPGLGAAEKLRARRAERRERNAEKRVREPAEPRGELTGLALLLDQLDALLRDPTLSLALKRFTNRVSSGLRDLAKALRLPRLRLPRLPRWLLLPLLALLLSLLALAFLLPDGDDGGGAPQAPAAPAQIALPGVGMPDLQAAPDDPPPARVALVVDGSYTPAALSRELRSLGAWLAANHAPGTRVSVIDATTGRASRALSAADLAAAPASAAGLAGGAVAQPGTAAAIRSAFAGDGGRRLLVNVGASAPASGSTTLTVATRRGAPAPSAVALRRGQRGRVTIDERRPDALAASVARALIAISGQSERR